MQFLAYDFASQQNAEFKKMVFQIHIWSQALNRAQFSCHVPSPSHAILAGRAISYRLKTQRRRFLTGPYLHIPESGRHGQIKICFISTN
ncbi:hypothetical protein TMES_02345 [Thalassospira mesophila]|uniref:Uncharacterized protein n=1 Tax=Thalassospira mesophila TaxID=1293891 RepID=A0A1Y2L436_9PROT|nr:hypothetical protein TMES_02345 [Thalassospira mesophila]